MPSPSFRRCISHHVTALAAIATLGSFAAPARAGGAVIPSAAASSNVTVDVEVAVAATPSGTTRWHRFTKRTGAGDVLWLVPVRPGAALDLKGERFLDALRESSEVRVLPPRVAAFGCEDSTGVDATAWTPTPGAPAAPKEATVLETEADARAHIAARGFAVGNSAASQLRKVFEGGAKLVALELVGASGLTSPTLRVSDDGPAVLPFALTGEHRSATKLTAFTIGPGVGVVPGVAVVQRGIAWGANGRSNYDAERTQLLTSGGTGARFVRETAGRELLFGNLSEQGLTIPPVVDRLFGAACASEARTAAAREGTVERICAPGSLGIVPGGAPCAPSPGNIPASAFACDTDDDLALAMSGQRAASVVATRFIGIVPAFSLGADSAITFNPGMPSTLPVRRADTWTCLPAPPPPAGVVWPETPGATTGPAPSPPATEDYVRQESCSGSSTVVYEEDAPPTPRDDSCGSSSPVSSTSSSSDSSDSDGDSSDSDTNDSSGWDSTDSTSDSSGWDSTDSTSDSSGCSGDTSTSSDSSSDSCDSGSTGGSDSSDGWDDSGMAPKAKKLKAAKKTGKLSLAPTNAGTPKKGPSPLSRVTVLAAALLLPLRRRLRARRPDQPSGSFRA